MFRQANYRRGFGSPGASGPSWNTGPSRGTANQGRMPWGGNNQPQPQRPGSYQTNAPSWANSARQPQRPGMGTGNPFHQSLMQRRGSYQANAPSWANSARQPYQPSGTEQYRRPDQAAQDQAYQAFQSNLMGQGLGAEAVGAMLQQPAPPVAAPQAPMSMLQEFSQLRGDIRAGDAGLNEFSDFRASVNPQAPPEMVTDFMNLNMGDAIMDPMGPMPDASVVPPRPGIVQDNLSPWAQYESARLSPQTLGSPANLAQNQQLGIGSPMSRMDAIQNMPMSPERRAMAKQVRQNRMPTMNERMPTMDERQGVLDMMPDWRSMPMGPERRYYARGDREMSRGMNRFRR